MGWHEAIIADYRDAHRVTEIIFEQTFQTLKALAGAGKVAAAEGSAIWSSLDLETGNTSILFNDVASRTFPHIVSAIGAKEVEPRTVKIGMGAYGRIFSYGATKDSEDVSDLFGAQRDSQ